MTYKRPRFVREESWRYARVSESWRSPRGKTSRVRRSKDGWPPVVKIGYSRPKASRGAHPSGLEEVMVWRPQDLEHVNPKTQAVRIAHTVGERKRVLILDQAKKVSIRILNPGAKKEAVVVPETTMEVAEPTEPAAPAEASPETTLEPKPETAEEASAGEEETEAPAEPAKSTKAHEKRSSKSREEGKK